MGGVHAGVDDRHGHLGASRRGVPCGVRGDVGPGRAALSLHDLARVAQAPELSEAGIVDRGVDHPPEVRLGVEHVGVALQDGHRLGHRLPTVELEELGAGDGQRALERRVHAAPRREPLVRAGRHPIADDHLRGLGRHRVRLCEARQTAGPHRGRDQARCQHPASHLGRPPVERFAPGIRSLLTFQPSAETNGTSTRTADAARERQRRRGSHRRVTRSVRPGRAE